MGELPLSNKVALVTGATRGAGRGIARMLGEAGATVYCTGRSVRGRPATAGRPETIEETAEMVTAEGGLGIAVRTDHTIVSEVQNLFNLIRDEQNRLDILVNDIWGGDVLTEWNTPFWQLSTEKGLKMLEQAVHSHIITSRIGVPMMVGRNAGLIIEITDGESLGYRGNLFYDLVKTSVIRLAYAMANDLKDHDVTVLALTPVYLRSEAILDSKGVKEENWQDAIKQDPNFAESETPCYVGRAVAALAADANVATKSGGLFSSWGLSGEYGYTDIDGCRPDWGQSWPSKVQKVLDQEGKPDERSLFEVRAMLHQIELEPAYTDEVLRLRAYVDRQGKKELDSGL